MLGLVTSDGIILARQIIQIQIYLKVCFPELFLVSAFLGWIPWETYSYPESDLLGNAYRKTPAKR